MRLFLFIFCLVGLVGLACDRNSGPGPGATTPVGNSTSSALVPQPVTPIGPPVDRIVLDGREVHVRWADGDSLRIESGPLADEGARLAEFNTLESYQPVQRWGSWTYSQLAEVNSRATALARSQPWECSSTSQSGGFGRILIECPALRDEMLNRGLAHLFTIHTPFDAPILDRQRAAQESARGIWARGVPSGIVTSVSSTADGHDRTFDRVVDTTTGQADRAFHDHAYETCQEVCHQDACMRYLPHDQRFGSDAIVCPTSAE